MNKTDYLIVKDEIPLNVEFDTIFNINTNKVTEFTHGFHKYPAKFIPQIPKWAIDKYLLNEKNKLILDPFCGSGTTLVEGILAGHHVVGVDIDALSVLISKVKTTKLENSIVNEVFTWVEKEIQTDFKPKFKPECKTLEHWFKPEYIVQLAKIRDVIEQITNLDLKNILLICFSSILRRVSNADDESQKAYVSHRKVKTPVEPCALFISQLQYFKERIISFSNLADKNLKNIVYHSDSVKKLSSLLIDKQFDLAITSPPYIKAIDYIYNQMVELFWIGDLFDMQTQTLQNEKKKLYVGTKHIQKAEYVKFRPEKTPLGITELDEKLQLIYKNDKINGQKHSYLTYRYFNEMELHFAEIHKVLKPQAHYVFVVGNSNVSNEIFDTASYLIEIAKRNGFLLANKWAYKIKNRFMRFDRKGRGGIIEIDWVLDFEKN